MVAVVVAVAMLAPLSRLVSLYVVVAAFVVAVALMLTTTVMQSMMHCYTTSLYKAVQTAKGSTWVHNGQFHLEVSGNVTSSGMEDLVARTTASKTQQIETFTKAHHQFSPLPTLALASTNLQQKLSMI